MTIEICLRTVTLSYYQVYLIFAIDFFTPLTPSILSTPLILPILISPLTIPIWCSPTFETKGCNIMAFIYLGVLSLRRLL